jgi:serine/threonine protein kinase
MVQMKLYQGDSSLLLNIVRGNVVFVAKLMLPIVVTLKFLSELEPPIYHRDMKPENLLFEGNGDNTRLVLADSGCAFFMNSNDERITLDYRALAQEHFLLQNIITARLKMLMKKGIFFQLVNYFGIISMELKMKYFLTRFGLRMSMIYKGDNQTLQALPKWFQLLQVVRIMTHQKEQIILPLREQAPKRLTATYKRNGTIALIAALAVHSGEITAKTMRSNNADDFLGFLKKIRPNV